MTKPPSEAEIFALAREHDFETRRRSLIPAPALAILIAGSLGSLLVASFPFLSQTASGALRGIAFICLGSVAMVFFASTWWHRQPITLKGGLSPSRPFFYHLGTAILFGTGFILAMAGASLIRQWLQA